MTRVWSFIHLEVLALKSYLKSFALLLGIAMLFGLIQHDSSAMISLFMVYVLMFLSYPFIISEKNNLDILYATLSLSRSQVVAGIYLLTVGTGLAVALLSLLFSGIMSALFTLSFVLPEVIFTAAVCFMIFGFIASLQLPIYFKYGYSKAKILALLPMMMLLLPVFALPLLKSQPFFNNLSDALDTWISNNQTASCLLPLLAGVLFLLISGRIACGIYSKREF